MQSPDEHNHYFLLHLSKNFQNLSKNFLALETISDDTLGNNLAEVVTNCNTWHRESAIVGEIHLW